MSGLNMLDTLDERVELGPLLPILDSLFGSALPRVEVADFFEAEEDGVTSFTLVLGVHETFLISVPGLSGISLGVVRESEDELPLILAEFVVQGAPAVTLRHFPLRVVIDNPVLEPLPPGGGGETPLEGFSFEVEGGLRVGADLAVRGEVESFSLPPFMVTGTGIALALDDCRLITATEDVDDDLRALGFDGQFRGIHAARAACSWDLPFTPLGADVPGLDLELANPALGNQGVSVEASFAWPVAHDGSVFDAASTDLLGVLLGWEFALESLVISLERNVPVGTGASGFLRVPFLSRIFRAEVGYREDEAGDWRFNLLLDGADAAPVDVPLGRSDYVLRLGNLRLEGSFAGDGDVDLSGRASVLLQLPGVSFAAASVSLSLEHRAGHDTLHLVLEDLDVDGYGRLEQARLVIVLGDDGDGNRELWMMEVLAELAWHDLATRVSLESVPAILPLPPDDAVIALRVYWVEDELHFAVRAELEEPDRLWRFLPAAARPQVPVADIDIELTLEDGDFSGEVGLECLLGLPDLAAVTALRAAGLDEVVSLDTGDGSGLVAVRFTAAFDSGEQGGASLKATLADPLAMTLQLPGLTLPEAPLAVQVTAVDIALTDDGADAAGVLELAGAFRLRPILPPASVAGGSPMMAQLLDRLLAVAHAVDLSGTASLTLGVAEDNAWFSVECEFSDAGLELDLFDLLARAALANGTLFGDDGGNEIDLDIDVTVALERLTLAIGSDTPATDGVPFGFGLAAQLSFAGQRADLVFELTHEHLSFGFEQLRIPLAVPKLPMQRSDLDRLRDSAGRWDHDTRWVNGIEPELDAQIDTLTAEVDAAFALLEQYEEDAVEPWQRFQLEFRTLPALQKQLFDVLGRKFLYQAVLAVHGMLGRNGGADSQATFQSLTEAYQDAVDAVFGSLHFDTQLFFQIDDARFLLPFDDPTDLRVEGGASLVGFAPDDPLAPLGDLVFTLGISADAIFFSVEGGADPIPLPDFGRYPGSAVHLDRLLIGYGYTKNSLKIDFAGELILSPQLIDDADSSSMLGFGVRLPENSRLKFQLDLIPIVLGKVEFLLPLVAFDIDLRSDRAPLPAPEGFCRPVWDGLQLHVPGAVRAALERYRFSPFFGPLPAPNGAYSFDLELGNEQAGLRHVADYQTIMPVLGTLPIPFLADGTPFFERYCMHLSVAGFGVSFDLARPFPQPSPLLVFELFGFLSDPSVPVAPDGHIAGLMYAELRHGRITVPERVLAMFPAASALLNRDVRARLDVGHVIGLFQFVEAQVQTLRERVAASTASGIDWLSDLAASPPELAIGDVLSLLPGELRSLDVEGRFVHFEASASFYLALPDDVVPDRQPEQPSLPGTTWQAVYANDFSTAALPGWKRFNYGLKQGAGNWRVRQGRLTQNRNVGDNSYARYGSMIVYTLEWLSELRLEVTANSGDDDGLGVVFHFQNERTFYRFRMTAQQGEWRLDRIVDGRIATLHGTAERFERDTDYLLEIEALSHRGGGTALPAALSRRDTARRSRTIDIDGLPGRSGDATPVTRIRIRVNGRSWCDLEDRGQALTGGHVGFDSWWNTGARFDGVNLYRRRRPESGSALPADAALYTDTASARGAETPAVLADFDDTDLAAAMDGAPAIAVTVRARTKVFAAHTVDMLGWIAGDGRFALVSRLHLPPLTLQVAGIDVPLPLTVTARMTLRGRSAGADSEVAAEAAVHGDWAVIPGAAGAPAIARMILGDADEPALLQLRSDREFALSGRGEVRLFGERVIVTGEIDVSHAHAMFTGDLLFAPGPGAGGQPLVELRASVAGRTGPGSFLALEGEGALVLFDRTFQAASVRASERTMELAAQLGVGARAANWALGPLPLKQIRLQLAGRLDFTEAVPALTLAGEGDFRIHGARFEGDCRFDLRGADWRLACTGRLFWQGRHWLDGLMILHDDAVTLGGRADFGLRLTPTQLPGGIEMLGLHLRATISGRLTLNAAGQLTAWEFDLDWQLAVRLPGTTAKQALPIATQQLKANGTHTATDATVVLMDLIAFDGLTLFDLGEFTLNVPTVDTDGGQPVYLHGAMRLDVDGDGAGITTLTPVAPDDDATPVFEVPGVLGFYEEEHAVDLPAVTVPVPVLSTDPEQPGDAPLFFAPAVTDTPVPIGRIRFDDTRFTLKLAWQAGKLGVLVADDDRFVPFSGNLFLGIVMDAVLPRAR